MSGVVEQELTPKLTPSRPVVGAVGNSINHARYSRSAVLPAAFSSILDGIVVFGAGVGSLLIAVPAYRSLISGSPGALPLLLVGAVALLAPAGIWERGLYSAGLLFARRLHFTRLATAWLQAVGLGVMLTLCALAVFARGDGMPDSSLVAVFGGVWLPLFGVSGLAALAVARVARRGVMAQASVRRAVAVGATAVCQHILERLDRDGHGGLEVIGIIEHDPLLRADSFASLRSFYGRSVLGGLPALMDLVRRNSIDSVIIALPWSSESLIRDIVQALAASPVDIYLAPSLDGVTFNGQPVCTIGGVPMLQAGQRPLQGWRAFAKRAEDLIAAGIMLLLAGPALVTIAIAIKVTSRGPVFFRQRRVGFNNQIFEVYKFRTMYTHLTDADAHQQTRKGDPRVTPIGAILRKASLDELPQILNVLKGDMSLVGPRPHALQTRACGRRLEEVAPDYAARHRVKPGITGWAQVNGYRGELNTFDKVINRVNHDLYYIDNWSLSFDIRILWQTARLMISDNNAY